MVYRRGRLLDLKNGHAEELTKSEKVQISRMLLGMSTLITCMIK